MNVTINDHPANSNQWNDLCLQNSNLLQTTYYDEVKTIFGQKPIYFQCFDNERLIAGVKAFVYVSKKLPVFKSISSSFTILGEAIVSDNPTEAIKSLNEVIQEYIKLHQIVKVRISGYYGGLEILPLYEKTSAALHHRFNVSAFDLSRTPEELWKNTKESHRRNINKAVKAQVELVEENDVGRFIHLLNETYAHQSKQAPNSAFIKKLYHTLYEKGFVKIYFSKHNGQYLASSFVVEYGRFAEYAFGGNLKNNVGAGHFLHWNIALLYKQKNFERYILGQVAAEGTNYSDNKKFELGITRFKKDFATFELPSATIDMITSPVKYKAWKLLGRLSGL